MDGASAEALEAHTRISQPALSRHLEKLKARGLVACDSRRRWRLLAADGRLAKALLSLTIEGGR